MTFKLYELLFLKASPASMTNNGIAIKLKAPAKIGKEDLLVLIVRLVRFIVYYWWSFLCGGIKVSHYRRSW